MTGARAAHRRGAQGRHAGQAHGSGRRRLGGDGGRARRTSCPLSIAWVDERIVLALEARSVTARNLTETGAARLAVGGTRDVVLLDTRLEATHEVAAAPQALADAYAAQSDWDPRADAAGYVFLVLRPDRVQAWTEVHELAGRTIMRAGEWVA